MAESKGTFSGRFWANNAPWYFKVARSALLVVVGTPLFFNILGLMPGRHLTQAEIGELRPIFNNAVDYNKIRVNSSIVADLYTGILGDDAMSFNNVIFAGPALKAGLDSATGDAKYELIHEVAHVMRYQHDPLICIRGPWQTAANYITSRDRIHQYEYRLEPGKKLGDYNLEQQASIIADYFNIRRGQIPLFLRNFDLTDQERDRLYRDALKGLFTDAISAAPAANPGGPAPAV
jgi:hypothetical protein